MLQLHSIPRCWEEKLSCAEWSLASVCLHKKGPTSEVVNYRPISLLATAYKVYGSILQQRLVSGKVMKYSVWFVQGSLNHPCHQPPSPHQIHRAPHSLSELEEGKQTWPDISNATHLSARRDVQSSTGHLSRCQICCQRLWSSISKTLQYFWHKTWLPAEPFSLHNLNDSSNG